MTDQPLVSCIIPTMPSRSAFLERALRCIASQFASGEVLIDCEPGTIGEKRNRLCAKARGEFIFHFDDDDFSGPHRITDQITRLQISGKAVTGYNMIRFHDPTGWWKPAGPSGTAMGASLAFRRDWWESHPFPNVQIGEDTRFINEAARAKQLIAVDGTDMMFSTNHAGNTIRRKISGGIWERADPFPGWMPV